ncbi:xanthine dehydrogenase accessory factor [Paraburkholderia sp. JPY162]|uniref:Xanthine dehydrogenase accessory factor n=1 Tax=Paraburkholderia youngii TaxID=2782701 RepID=A0A7W8P7C3_9BURK|nr:xanthine dehydrogenase accessory factor [Paraburkholderia youngii]
MQAWLTDLQHLLAHGDAAVLVTVARVEGSAPRDAGTKMIVTRASWAGIRSARAASNGKRSRRFCRVSEVE